MDVKTLSRIDDELDSSEVAALCFLCRDAISRKNLEQINDANGLFQKLKDKCLLENRFFLSELLHTICREDLLNLLEGDSRPSEETDAKPVLSPYRVMLYKIYENTTEEILKKLKFLMSDKLGRRQTEMCKTALDLFTEMERTGLLSNTKLDELYTALLELDFCLASAVRQYMQGIRVVKQQSEATSENNNTPHLDSAVLTVTVNEAGDVENNLFCDAEPNTRPSPLSDQTEYYAMTHNPRGLCVVINNEIFKATALNNRAGTMEDEKILRRVFTQFGFVVQVHNDLTAEAMRHELQRLGRRNFLSDDALVVCVLSHGELGCVYGTDGQEVTVRELTRPFTSGHAPTLAGKPKMFFIQACQGDGYQKGYVPCPPRPREEVGRRESHLEEDAGRVHGVTVPDGADFLLGMATVPECKSFRNTSKGSIYIQELCAQLLKSAQGTEMDDILSILTRVNREVSKGEYLNYKQMPEPKYTLTKKLVLRFV